MNISKLKPMTIFPDSDKGYWIYTGFHKGNRNCGKCHKVRWNTHEFLHYTSLTKLKSDIRLNNFGRWFENYYYGSECVKEFIKPLTPI